MKNSTLIRIIRNLVIPTCFFLLISGCSNDPNEISLESSEKPGEVNGEIKDHLFLVNDAGSNRVYLMNKLEEIIFEWQLQSGIGNDCFLLENGKLLALLQADDPQIEFGGYGGKIQIINPDFSVNWEYILSDANRIAHHDIEMLPNGNILTIVWDKKSSQEAKDAGFIEDYAVYPETLLEINPETNQIVWEWNSWDHLIQDHDSTKDNYGDVASNPSKIDINYSLVPNGDIMHANGLDYDSENDLIYLSVNFFSEIWVIDHSTTTEVAKTDSGGRFNKGGDLIYRFGNPEAYKNKEGQRLFYNNHYPNLILEDGIRKMLVFMNGNHIKQSTVYEFNLDQIPSLNISSNNEPPILWEFTSPDLFSSKVSGAELLKNGNILITIGTTGIWEINRQGETLWKFEGDGFYWRTYPYHIDTPAIKNLNIQMN